MAVIGKIREKSTLLIIIVGGAIVLFVLGEFLLSGGAIMQGDQTSVGVVDGESIDVRDFEARVQTAIEAYQKNYTQGAPVDVATQEAIRNQTWEQMVNETIMANERAELGLTVTTDEMFDLVSGTDPDQYIRQAQIFQNPNTGLFDPALVLNYLKQLDVEGNEAAKAEWLEFEKEMKKRRLDAKYLNLIKKGFYITKAEAENDYVASNKRVDIRYVAKYYTSMPDSEVTVSDSDLKKYFDKHKENYRQEKETREIEFVTFDVKPSTEDINEVKEWIAKVAKEFMTVEDDSAYINEKTDPGTEYFPIWKTRVNVEDGLDTALFDAAVGTVVGPYRIGDTYKVAKLLGTKMAPDSVEARHILLQPKKEGDTEETLTATLDSIKGLIKSGRAKFADLAMELSDDRGSAEQGGDLGKFAEGMMVKPFNDAAFSTKKGEMTIVASQFGVHLIEVTNVGEKVKKANIGIIERAIIPSDKTYRAFYTQAEQFARENNTEEKFENAVVEQGLNKRLSQPLGAIDSRIAGLEEPRALIKWAFKADKGAVSKVHDLGDKFVVAVLVKVKKEGYSSIEEIRSELEAEVRKEKKAEKFVAEFEEALKSNTTIDAVGTAVNTGVAVGQNITFFQGSVPGIAGREPKLAGTVINMKVGEMTAPVVGNNGVFVAVVDNIYEAPEATDYSSIKNRLGALLSNRANEAYEILKDKAGVEDNRAKFY